MGRHAPTLFPSSSHLALSFFFPSFRTTPPPSAHPENPLRYSPSPVSGSPSVGSVTTNNCHFVSPFGEDSGPNQGAPLPSAPRPFRFFFFGLPVLASPPFVFLLSSRLFPAKKSFIRDGPFGDGVLGGCFGSILQRCGRQPPTFAVVPPLPLVWGEC